MKQFKDLMIRARANATDSVAATLASLKASEVRCEAREKSGGPNRHSDVEVIVTAYCRVEKIDAALARMSAGNYGECLNCGDDIGDSRLLAQPWAAYCASCQKRRALRLLDQLPREYKITAGKPLEAAWRA